jgi:hypothetical protein
MQNKNVEGKKRKKKRKNIGIASPNLYYATLDNPKSTQGF